MASFFELFWSFFKIGTFTIGGGYAMIPLMEKEIVQKKKWLEEDAFMDVLSLSQAMPGLFAVNMATNVGYRIRGLLGAIVSVIGNIFIPICIILGVAIGFRYLNDNPIFKSIFKGIRPAVVALIAAPVFNMAKTAKLSWRNLWIPILAVILIWLLKVSPIWIVFAAGFGGFVYGHIKERRKREK